MNLLDLFFVMTMVISFSFRLSEVKEHQIIGRILYCINTIFWVAKLMELVLINKYTGPLIIIASRMVSLLTNRLTSACGWFDLKLDMIHLCS